jgi:NitT/TauT family transport system substrate-binding protein
VLTPQSNLLAQTGSHGGRSPSLAALTIVIAQSKEDVMTLMKLALKRAAAVGVVALAVLIGFASAVRADDDVKIRFSWKLKGEYGPFYLAQEKGFYVANGLNVRMGEGAGAPAALGALLQGQEDAVVLQGIFAVSAIQKGMPIKIVALYIPRVGVVVISHNDNPVRAPKDMEGKSIAVAVGDTGTTYLSTFAAKNGVDYSKIKRVQIDAQSRATFFLQKRVDMFTGFLTNDLPALEKATNTKYPTINMAEYGLAIPGLAIVATDAAITKRGDVFKRYLAAVDKGIEATRQDKTAATQALMKSWSTSPSADVVETQVKATIDEMTRVPGRPAGWIDPNLITATLDLLKTDEDIGTPKPANLFFSNDLLPK